MKIGVRRLVEFCCISGDLGGMNQSGINALQGQKIHRLIQEKYADKARSEVTLKAEFQVDGTDVELGGRLDLLFDQEEPPRIEEIKTVVSASRHDDNSVHWAQLTPNYNRSTAFVSVLTWSTCLPKKKNAAKRSTRQPTCRHSSMTC